MQGLVEEAKEMQDSLLKIEIYRNDITKKALSSFNYAIYYNIKGEPNTALNYIKRGIVDFQNGNPKHTELAAAHIVHARVLYSMREYKLSETCFIEAINFCEQSHPGIQYRKPSRMPPCYQ